jgi:hypothetical protein
MAKSEKGKKGKWQNVFVLTSIHYNQETNSLMQHSQPGVGVPLWVRLKLTGGMQANCRKLTTFKST